MFTREKTISLPLSTSFLPNNLSVFVESESRIHYAITHLNSVILSSVENQIIHHKELPCQISGTANACNFILQAKWVTVGKRAILVVCSQRGIQIYEWDGSLFLHWHAFKNQENDDLEETYALGVGVLGNELLCIGTYSGSILVFSVPQEGEITFSEKVTGTHSVPITDICNDKNILASSDSSGMICLWANNGFLEKKTTIASYDSPCTSLAIFQDSLIAAYGSGHLRIFKIDTGTIKAEVTAHTKWITAIDVAPKTGMLLSVSEDTFLRIWQLGKNEEPVISHKFSECVTDSLLCGGKFENENGDHLCLSSYDSPDLIRYHLLS